MINIGRLLELTFMTENIDIEVNRNGNDFKVLSKKIKHLDRNNNIDNLSW